MYKKSIIVIVYGQLEWTKKCIDAIFKHTNDFEIIIWNNGANEDRFIDTNSYLKDIKDNNKNVTVIDSDSNIGFTIPCNRCAKVSTGEYLIFVNNDLIVCNGWSEKLIQPFTNAVSSITNIGQTGILGLGLKDNGEAYAGKVEYIDGALFAISRDIYNKTGLFDEKIEFAYCEDNDLSLHIQSLGYRLCVVKIPGVYHKRAATRNSLGFDLMSIELKNRKYVHEKWGSYFKSRSFK